MPEIIFFGLIIGLGGGLTTILLGLPESVAIVWLVLTFLLLVPGLYASFSGAPFVPSARKRQRMMLKLADLKGGEIVYDLGCGDGRFLRASSPLAKKAIGYELSIPLVLFGKLMSAFDPKVSIQWKNIWKQDYKDADVIFCYLLPKTMARFYREIWPQLKPGTRVVSNAFSLKDLQPVEKEEGVYVYVKTEASLPADKGR